MKKLLVVLGLSIGLVAQAATISLTTTNASTNSVVAGYLLVSSITFANGTSTDAASVTLYDAPSTNLTYTLSSYTNNTISSTITNTTVWTNYFGVSQTNSFLMRTNTTSVVSASTNTYPVILAVNVPASGQSTFTFSPAREVNMGILAVGNTNFTAVVDYLRR